MVNGDCLGQDMRSVVPEYAQNEECDFLIMYMFIHFKQSTRQFLLLKGKINYNI